eukprot:Transcript_4144.p1 GENE.Transcript_4144~~Transcript_4144.p1  ORF type:complete len:441 (+),score=169.61 Transcript_4144:126-1448(+)
MSKSVVGSSKSLKSDAASSKSLVKHEAASSRSLVPSEADSLLASRAMSQFGVSSSLSMRNVQSPDLAAWRTGQVRTMAERGRDAKEKDLQWERSLAAWEAHRQRMEGHNRKLVSARQREVSKRVRQKEGQTTEREMTERQALLRELREKHVVDEERATTAAHESSAQRHRRHVEHQEYLARLRRQQREREDAALRAIKAKDEAARLAQQRAEEAKRQKVQQVVERRLEDERRRKQCEEALQKQREQLRQEQVDLGKRWDHQEEKLREHRERRDSETQAKARQLGDALDRSHECLQEILDKRLEYNLQRMHLSSARSENCLLSRRNAQQASAQEGQARYGAAAARAMQTRGSLDQLRQHDIAQSLALKQRRRDDLRRRRLQRDLEAAQHTYSQLYKTHALSEASWKLQVSASFTAPEIEHRLSSAQSVPGSLNPGRRTPLV